MILVAFPLYVTFVASTLTLDQIVTVPMPLLPGDQLLRELRAGAHRRARPRARRPRWRRCCSTASSWRSAIAVGKIAISILSAFAIVYFRFPLRNFFFWMIFVTLMLPIEVRIIPTFKVASDLGLLDSYAGLTLPLIASATATFLFRQFFLTIPDELAEAARIDGAGPMRFFWDVVLPLSKTSIAALFVILFIHGWNQYLWPLLITSRGVDVHGGDRHQADDHRRRRANEWNLDHGHRDAGAAAARAGGDPDAEVVREGPRGDRKIEMAEIAHATSRRATAKLAGDPRRGRRRSPTASSS